MATILIVDDNSDIRTFLRRILSTTGHRIVDARNGKEAVALLQHDPADLVISDIFMPEADGLELMKDLRNLRPGLKVIAISGGGDYGDMDILRAAKMVGAFRVFTKPFHAGDMIAAVKEALGETPTPPTPNTN